MPNIFIAGFGILSILCALLFIYTRQAVPTISDAAFKQFQRVYLVVYMLAMGEWTIQVETASWQFILENRYLYIFVLEYFNS